ncbi:PTS transporter subunit EIIC [Atopobium sp. oral taxon 810]|uniref:PTS sugar transporter subunit IIC n=1 Tax=Atopobium sp. oral taxon 810 TaxID=712158 RepID=UPI0003974D76|nr:PTS transporter subunit EIIC [Atopobium sp. oral taxon 810]ERI06015.1 PTS system, lactose/cellobiose family IIC component [Atopobium sp. oral taxon 810 str. F0209]
MEKLIGWLENSFAPRLQKVANLQWVVVIKDSLMQILPFILAGSLFCCLAILNDYIPWLPSFWTPFGWTMSKLSLMVAFLVPFNYCEKKRYRKQRIIAGITGLMVFMIMVEPEIVADNAAGTFGQGHSAYGAGGMFAAIIAGIAVGLIFGAFNKFSFFKEDSAIPDFVRQWFDALLPIMLTISAFWLLVDVAGFDIYNIIVTVFMPLQNILDTPGGMVVTLFLYCVIYSMGISTWVLTPVTEPVKLALIADNLAMVAAGTATVSTLHIFTETFIYTTYLWIGGVGATLSLVVLMCLSKNSGIKALGRACLVPGIFNINEPVVFGAIAWNPLLMLPMWLQGIILPILTILFTKVIPFAPIPRIQFELWYCPYPISTFISTQGSITGVIFAIVTFLVSGLIWYPFFKAYEDQENKKEQAELEAAKA